MLSTTLSGGIPYCEECNGFIKPDIMLHGDELPVVFKQNRDLTAEADLCIVMGTSSMAYNFACLPELCAGDIPRLLINQDHVTTLDPRADGVLFLGDCDDGVRNLADALGLDKELQDLLNGIKQVGRKIVGSEESNG